MKKPKTMTPAEQRVAIAKDALAWIEAGALKPRTGAYVSPTHDFNLGDFGKQLRDTVLGQCVTCALGAMFIAKAVRFDECPVTGVSTFFGSNVRMRLAQHFEIKQIGLIEAAFECCPSYSPLLDPAAAVRFGRKYRSDRNRLTAILCNIIANDGTFVPEARS